jgi:hypothetical protein
MAAARGACIASTDNARIAIVIASYDGETIDPVE